MGDLKQIELLEVYIEDFGKELNNVKKASDYLELIEKFQEEVTRTTNILDQSKESIVIHQGIIDSKLALYQSILQNIEQKQKVIEGKQEELTQKFGIQFERQNDQLNELLESMKEFNQLTKGMIEHQFETQQAAFKKLSAKNFVFFCVNAVFGIGIIVLIIIK
ncbi:hypothetical protein [Saccharococcus sp. Marseille-Q5394]|uniref:hypothetical protein n=1 Tax=Saccharococcus sp. Marseille-Q5394 TaxID=2972778 RepID=UPI0021CAC437|nr:hypothetical protein [Saccharococcus sp. Marseille-Q5394]